jgi:hypothetical protein
LEFYSRCGVASWVLAKGNMLGRAFRGSLLVCGGVVLGVVSAGLYVWSQRENMAVPMYERAGADMQACSVAEIAIAGHRAPASTTFASACRAPVVTRLWNRPGFVVVTRAAKELDATSAPLQRTFSVLLDGRHSDGWQIVDVRPAPNELTVDISMLPLSGPEAQEQPRLGSSSGFFAVADP